MPKTEFELLSTVIPVRGKQFVELSFFQNGEIIAETQMPISCFEDMISTLKKHEDISTRIPFSDELTPEQVTYQNQRYAMFTAETMH